MTESVRCKATQLSLDWGGTVRNRYLVRVPVPHSREDVLSPDYLGDLINPRRLTVGDIVEFEWEDFSAFIECQVRAQVPEVRQCVLAVRFEPEVVKVDIPKGYDIEWRGKEAGAKHVITYNGKDIKGGFDSRESAAIHANWLADRADKADSTRSAVRKATGKAKPVAKVRETADA
ncbi:hypothetical protein [Henriciella pelagia]|uniref:hypothetical protein n=1 Tax=Henriciella pelagia TaxID=1977912 RepID=UPI0035187011